MNKFDLQHMLDIDKWMLSEKNGYDMCGNMYYCEFCDKHEICPCANAKLRYDAHQQTEAKTIENVDEKPAKKKKIVRSHQEKYDMASDILKERYAQIREEMLSYKDVTSRVSKRCDSYRAHCEFIARVFVTGKSLKMYFPLDPQDPELAKYPHIDVNYKKTINETPFSFKVNSKLAVKRAKELIAIVCEEKGLKKK